MASSDNVIKVAAMGRPFTLGMMYNARTEQMVPGMALWGPKVLADNTVVTAEPSSQFKVLTSDSLESKTSMLEIDASLKASFLAGMIEVGGAAKFLNSYKTYKNQCRATFQYQGSTVFKQLSLASLGPLSKEQIKMIDRNFATHVVTGIVYGANAYFVFDSKKLESSSVQNMHTEINAVMNKVPSFNAGGKIDIKLTKEEKKLANEFSCTFYGDVILESNPTTFEEAVKTCANLPSLLKKSEDNVPPLVVWMLPLTTLCPKAPSLPRDISFQLVRQAEEAIEDVKQFQSACAEAQAEVVSRTFPDLCQLLLRFNTLCGHYIEYVQGVMSVKLPKIRAGCEQEKEVMQVFLKREMSPFSHAKLSQWMDTKLREVTVIQSIVDMMAGIDVKLIQSQSALDKEIMDANVHDTLCYVFTSLEAKSAQVEEMAKYLDSGKSVKDVPGYITPTVLTEMRDKAKKFRDTAAAMKGSKGVKFLMIALRNPKQVGASIYHYHSSQLVTDNFSWPTPADPEKITDKQDLMWYAVDLTFDQNTAHSCIVLSDNNKKATYGKGQLHRSFSERFNSARQVICTEGLTRPAYWEVEWSDGFKDEIAIGVTYKNIDRKDVKRSWLGKNAVSWCFGKSNSNIELFAEHNNERVSLPLPKTGIKRLGVFMNSPRGTLSFYNVSSTKLSHLHSFSHTFTAPVYPGCYLKTDRSFIYFSTVE